MKYKSKKRKGSDDDDEDIPSPKTKRTKDTYAGDEDFFCELSKTRRVTVQTYNGVLLVCIREYYSTPDGLRPGAKGMNLTIEQWEKLVANVGKVNEIIAENEDS